MCLKRGKWGNSSSRRVYCFILPQTHMEEQERVIGEVIAQFYSFFDGVMNMRERLAACPGMCQSDREQLLRQLTELEGEGPLPGG